MAGLNPTKRPRYQLGVTQLVSWFLTTSLTAESGDDGVSAREGMAAHQRVQRSWPESIQREVRLKAIHDSEICRLELSGRADGLEATPERLRILEIKTLRQPLETLSPAKTELHWLQARVYAGLWLLSPSLDVPSVELELHYVDIATGSVQSQRLTEDPDVLRGWFVSQWERIVAQFETLATHRQHRNEALASLSFPFPQFREGQRDFARAVYRSLRDQGMLMVEAPTGSGKSLAALFPALKAMGDAHADQIFYASTRNAGQRSALEALQQLAPTSLRVLQLQGMEKLCPGEATAGCQPERCERRTLTRAQLDTLAEGLLEKYWMDSDTLIAEAQKSACCPHQLQSRLQPWADILVGDVNYILNPLLRSDFNVSINRPFLLADEAHNLPDRARQMFSAELPLDPFFAIEQLSKTENKALYKAARTLRRRLEHPPPQDPATLSALSPDLQRFIALAEQQLVSAVDLLEPLTPEFAAQLRHSIQLGRQWLTQSRDIEADFVCLPDTLHGKGWGLQCLSPAHRLQTSYKPLAGACFFSASLSPPDFFCQLLGLPETTQRLRLNSPFPVAHLRTLIYTATSLRLRDRQQATHLNDLCALVTAVWQTKPGNYWIFTPSFDYLAQLEAALHRANPDLPLISQPRRSSLKARQDFLDQFLQQGKGGKLGLVCLGSIFTESIDLPGEALIGVIILGTGLPQPSAYQLALQTHFADTGLDAWRYSTLLPGWQKVVQAAGRVIRNEHDRGVVILADQRFTQRDYATLFPPHWQPTACRTLDEIKTQLTRFWSE